jgi:hypothetical protein
MRRWQSIGVLALSSWLTELAAATEPNETFASRTVLAPGVLTVSDTLTPGLQDAPDTLLGARNLFGQITETDDDSSPAGNGFASALFDVPTNSGIISFSVTGTGDDSFTGSHFESGAYAVFVDVYDFFGDPIEQLSASDFLEPGEVHDYQQSNGDWASYDVFIDNLVGGASGADVDFFTFQGLTPGAAFTAETFDPESKFIDTRLGWFDSNGSLIADDDDGAGFLLSKLMGNVPANGALTFAVTGGEDAGFAGAHTEEAFYELRLTLDGGGFVADFNHDNRVNGADLTTWRTAFGPSAAADADHDNDSDGADFLIWQRELGSMSAATSAVTAVPEPPTVWLLLLAVGAGGACIRP